MKEAAISTLIHAAELVTCLLGALVVTRYFDLGNDAQALLAGIVLNALSKFARTSDSVPYPDFVNGS